MPRHVAATHADVMAAPAMYGCPVTRAPAAVPESSVDARPSVNGKWQGQITNAPITQARPRLSVCVEDVGTGHTGPLVLIATLLALTPEPVLIDHCQCPGTVIRHIIPGRGIPPRGVAPPSHMPNMLGRRALRSGRALRDLCNESLFQDTDME